MHGVKIDLKQGSQDWLIWRQMGLGASDATHLMRTAPWSDPKELFQQKLGRRRGTVASYPMLRGLKLEPQARELAEKKLKMKLEPVCLVHPEYRWMKASLDGLSPCETILIEIKCPMGKAEHDDNLKGKVSTKYGPQMQHQFFVSGCERGYFITYHPDFGRKALAITPVLPDAAFQALYVRRAKRFYAALEKQRNK